MSVTQNVHRILKYVGKMLLLVIYTMILMKKQTIRGSAPLW
jgi:hypothetical protein